MDILGIITSSTPTPSVVPAVKQNVLDVDIVGGAASSAGEVGAGPTDASTTRVVAATDSPEIALLQAIQTLLSAPAAAMPPITLSDGSDITRNTIDFTSAADQIVIPAVAGKVIRVYRIRLMVNKPVTIDVWDGPSASGSKKETIQINGTNGGMFVLDFCERDPYYTTTSGNGLILKCSDATARVTGRASFTQS